MDCRLDISALCELKAGFKDTLSTVGWVKGHYVDTMLDIMMLCGM